MTYRILIVEADRDFRENLARRLADGAWRVLVAGGGREACELVASQAIDVVLLDLTRRMPDGLATLASLKRISPATEVITTSGAGHTALAIEAMKRGAFDHLTDPFSVGILKERLAAACRHRLPPSGGAAEGEAARRRPAEVLLVDDEEQFAETLAERLALRGLRARVAGSGQEALGMVTRQWPDAVVLDLQMPDLDGLEVLRRLKGRRPALPVIILTGHGSASRAAAARRLGAVCCLQKPAEIEELVDELIAVCRPCRDALRGRGDPEGWGRLDGGDGPGRSP